MTMIDFQPMPKRFMVWDKEAHDFVKGVNGFILTWREIANLVEPTVWDCATELDEIAERFTVIQSANLYAGNNEVFEGSLLQTDKEGVGYVYMEDNGKWMVLFKNEVHSLSDLLYAPSCKLVGHILSSPELLEEK